MPAAMDLTGRRVGRLTVIKIAAPQGRARARAWTCRCDCGAIRVVHSRRLLSKSNPTSSCGCYHRDRAAERARTLSRHHFRAVRRCAVCAIQFLAKNRRNIYCSGYCLNKAHRLARVSKDCAACGAPMIGVTRCQRYCSPACRRFASNKRRAGTRFRRCARCDNIFDHNGSRAKYCSDDCRRLAAMTRVKIHAGALTIEQQYAVISAVLGASPTETKHA